MIVCPHCGAKPPDWVELRRSPVNPADDFFRCCKCGRTFRRYDKPNSATENGNTKPNKDNADGS